MSKCGKSTTYKFERVNTESKKAIYNPVAGCIISFVARAGGDELQVNSTVNSIAFTSPRTNLSSPTVTFVKALQSYPPNSFNIFYWYCLQFTSNAFI